MEWFVLRTAQKLPGVFSSAFWTDLLPQASASSSAIRHAVLALSSVHKCQALNGRNSPINAGEGFTLQQYNRAASELRLSIRDQNHLTKQTALIACVIFIQLEYLRAQFKSALIHLQHGLSMLGEIVGSNGRRNEANQDTISKWLVRTFTSLCLQAKLWGQEMYAPHLTLNMCISPTILFMSLDDARFSLERVILDIVEYTNSHQGCSQHSSQTTLSSTNSQGETTRTFLQKHIDQWFQIYEKSSPNNVKPIRMNVPPKDLFAWRLLRVYYNLGLSMTIQPSCHVVTKFKDDAELPVLYRDSILTLTSNSNSEMLNELFDSILSQCDFLMKIAHRSPEYNTGPDHVQVDRDASQAIADIGWIPAVYHVATNNGYPTLRRRAIDMLHAMPHREGIWDSDTAAIVAEKILSIDEERYLQSLSDITVQNKLTSCGSVKCTRRTIRLHLPEAPDGSMILALNPCICQRDENPKICYSYDLRTKLWTNHNIHGTNNSSTTQKVHFCPTIPSLSSQSFSASPSSTACGGALPIRQSLRKYP